MFLGLTVIVSLVVFAISIHTISTEYDNAVHRPNSSDAGMCLEVSKEKAKSAQMSILAAITINTIAIGIVILFAAKVLSCICDCVTCPDNFKILCNWLLVLFYVGLVVTVAVVLQYIDPSCKKISLALIMLLIITPVTCCPLWCIARATDTVNSNTENLIDDHSA